MNIRQTPALAAAAAMTLSFALPTHAQPAPSRPPAPDASAPTAPEDASPGADYGPRRSGHGFGQPETLAAYQALSRDRTMQADADHDGRVSLAEWTAYHAERGGEGGGGWRGRRGFGGDPSRQFQAMDANHDGYVTPAEVDTASAERFARLDANHDGVLTPDERRAGRGGGAEGGAPTQPLAPPQ